MSCSPPHGGPWPAPLPKDQPGRNSNASGLRRLREDLPQILTAASSAWQVNGDGTGLARRAGETACAALDRAATAAGNAPRSGSADKQIRAAWRALYKLEPEPEMAYREAVKAVESAAHAVIQPNHAGATLGSMRGELPAQAARWTLAIPGKDGSGDIAPLLAMIDLLWGRTGMATWPLDTSPRRDTARGRNGCAPRGHLGELVRLGRCAQKVAPTRQPVQRGIRHAAVTRCGRG